MEGKCCSGWQSSLYTIFRLIVGLLFLFHGINKFTGGMAQGWFLAAAIIEVVVGVLLILGWQTCYASTLGAVEMIVAFLWRHVANNGWNFNPFSNGGEAALLFLAAFLVLAAWGAGSFSIDGKIGCESCCEHEHTAPAVAPKAKSSKKKR